VSIGGACACCSLHSVLWPEFVSLHLQTHIPFTLNPRTWHMGCDTAAVLVKQ
jgi:hypothetical protein